MKNIKILLVQTANSNLGDNVIADNHTYLIRKISGYRNVKIFNYNIASRDVGQIKYVDAVIFAGGILKITNEMFYEYIPEVIETADQNNIPVYISNIGVEKFYEDDEKSRRMRAAVNLPCVKGIAVRDDIETMKRDYLNPENHVKVVPVTDVAIWSAKTYARQLPKKFKPEENQVIGLGITRHKLYMDYGHPEITKEFQLDFWKTVIEILDRKNIPWVCFTNGDVADEKFAEEVLEYVGHGSKLPIPADGVELVKMISQFRGVIAGRMHSNIISYALSIPSIGFVWNQNIRFWSHKIGYPERFIDVDSISPELAVSLLEEALKSKCGPNSKMQKEIYIPLKAFLKQWVFGRKTQWHKALTPEAVVKVEKALLAEHLAALRTRYPGTDSLEALCSAAAGGYRNVQVDVRLTLDDSLVCVNRWCKETYKVLGYNYKELKKTTSPISAEEFLNLKYYKRFKTMTFDMFASKLSAPANLFLQAHQEYGDETLKKTKKREGKKPDVVIGLGRPDEKHLRNICSQLRDQIAANGLKTNDFILRLEKAEDIDIARSKLLNIRIMYFMIYKSQYGNDEELLEKEFTDAVNLSKEKKIWCVCVSTQTYRTWMPEMVHDAGLLLCLNTNDKIDSLTSAVSDGADLVTNSTYDVKYIKALLS